MGFPGNTQTYPGFIFGGSMGHNDGGLQVRAEDTAPVTQCEHSGAILQLRLGGEEA